MLRCYLSLLVLLAASLAQDNRHAQPPIQFVGRKVTVIDPGMEDDGFFPKGSASVCLEGPPERECFTMPEGIGADPRTEIVALSNRDSALLFSAHSGGVSGFAIHFALLRPDVDRKLTDLFSEPIELSNQSQHAFWKDPAVSPHPIFVTADFVWGPDEAHYSPHRYTISAYTLQDSDSLDTDEYFLDDRYMTVREYDSIETPDLLVFERQEILGRLRRRVAYERAQKSGHPK